MYLCIYLISLNTRWDREGTKNIDKIYKDWIKKLTFPLSMSGLSVTYLSNWVLVSQENSGAKYSSINDRAKDEENM